MMNILTAVAIIIVAALVAMYSPMLGGVVAMLPTKAIGYTLILAGKNDPTTLKEGVRGMLIGTSCITMPLLIFLWWLTK